MTKFFSFLVLVFWAYFSSAQEVRLNPTPHEISYKDGFIDVNKGIRLSRIPATLTDAIELKPVSRKAPKLRIYINSAASRKYGVKDMDGAYVLDINAREIVIAAQNDLGAFYALQTLWQLSQNGKIPFVTINDYPDLPFRGVVEGFYGNPWSHQVRLSLIEYYGKYKMNKYLYGPKDDPYHSSPHWREPYPAQEKEQIVELINASKKNRVDFVWAIHPGQDIQWTEADYLKLLQKFNGMYDLGVRHFAVFFDDISGIGTNPVRQAELLNRLQKEFVEIKKDVAPLIMCPTEYTELWANPSPGGYLSILGNHLHPSIKVMWTGHTVSGDITNRTLEFVNSRIKRPALIWWNFPVTDYIKNFNMQGPVYGLTEDATTANMAGLVSNPMEHGEASKLALYGVADYTWNVKAYKPLENWEAGIRKLMPGAPEAYRVFAIHSTDNETGYRRDESWETQTIDPLNYTPEAFNKLYEEFRKISLAPSTIFSNGKNNALISELRPWLVEFEKLGKRGLQTMDALKLLVQKNYSEFWNAFRASQMSPAETEAYNAHKSGTRKLQPFISNTRDEMEMQFYSALSGKPLARVKAIGSFNNINTRLSDAMLDGNLSTYYHSAQAQRAGNWIGVDLGEITDVHTIQIYQGRNDSNDVDYFDAAALQISADGQQWQTLQDNIKEQYAINYSGLPVKARYVRLLRLDKSQRSNWLAVRRFAVNPWQENPVLVSNIPLMANRQVKTTGTRVGLSSILEIIEVKPGEYFGIGFPVNTAFRNVLIDLGDKSLAPEYSVDGSTWKEAATSAKIIRYFNHSKEPVSIRLKKFEIETVPASEDISAVFDKNMESYLSLPGREVFPVTSGSNQLILLSGNNTSAFHINQLDKNGQVVQENAVSGSYNQITMHRAAFQVEIKGKVDLYEMIFR